MLTSFFSKSKPVNYLLVAIFMALFFVGHHFLLIKSKFDLVELFFQTLLLLVFLISMLLVDFISRKNNLTKSNTFNIFLFALFLTTLPSSFLNNEVLISNFLILLALRRIISLKTKKDIQKKIFDAALWIALASCFYFWSILFMGVLFYAVAIYAGTNFKNYIIPFVGMAAVIMLANTYTLLVQNAFYLPLDWVKPSEFDFGAYHQLKLVFPLSVVLAILIWSIFDFYLESKHTSKKKIRSLSLIIVILVVAVSTCALTFDKNGSELLFIAMPFSVLAANYFEKKRDVFFKEVILWLFLVLPFSILFL